MENIKIPDLFSFHPDPKAVRERMIAEAAELYRKGLSNARFQPEYSSYDGHLDKFYLYPTFDCPLRCPYCYAEGGERKTKELSAFELLRITEEAISAGYKTVVIVGGEPLVYYDFENYLSGLEKIDKKGRKFVLRSSFGFSIEDDLLKRLCCVFDEIVVSIDGDQKTHDAVRGKGTWRFATDNAERAISYGAVISVSAVMTREQKEGIPGEFLKDYCKRNRIKKLVIQSPVPLGRAEKSRIPYFEWRTGKSQGYQILPKFTCGLGHSLYMEPDGSLYPCYAWCEQEHKLGDLSTENLQTILDRGDLLKIINSGVDTNEKCRTCEVRYFCGGACKIWVNNRHDINSGDFDCTEMKQSYLTMLEKFGIILENRQQIPSNADE